MAIKNNNIIILMTITIIIINIISSSTGSQPREKEHRHKTIDFLNKERFGKTENSLSVCLALALSLSLSVSLLQLAQSLPLVADFVINVYDSSPAARKQPRVTLSTLDRSI